MSEIDSRSVSRADFDDLKRLHDETGGWQQRKSEITRVQLLEATVRCIVRDGFAQVRTRDIAEEAGVSRGAMMHHFANKRQLFEKALSYVQDCRIRNYSEAILQLKTPEERAQRGIDVYWQQLQSPYFVAAHELHVAARSDENLAKILKRQRLIFDDLWRKETLKVFPEWADTGALFDLVMDITQFMMEGMAIHSWIREDEAQNDRLKAYLKARLREMHRATQEDGADVAAKAFLDY